MTANEITLIITSATALAAIIVPTVTTYISTRSAERMKRIDLRDPRAYDALNEFVKTYSNLNATPGSYSYLDTKDTWGIHAGYKSFVVACHNLLPFINNQALQLEICQFMQLILSNGKSTNQEIDKKFDQLTIRIGSTLVQSRKYQMRKNVVSRSNKRKDSSQ